MDNYLHLMKRGVIENLETARAMLMYSAASEREASLVEKIRQLEPVMIISEGFHLKQELFMFTFSPLLDQNYYNILDDHCCNWKQLSLVLKRITPSMQLNPPQHNSCNSTELNITNATQHYYPTQFSQLMYLLLGELLAPDKGALYLTSSIPINIFTIVLSILFLSHPYTYGTMMIHLS